MERLPILWVSSFLADVFDDGREGELELLLRINDRKPPSRLEALREDLGLFEALRGE
jgi:hypothetical protein